MTLHTWPDCAGTWRATAGVLHCDHCGKQYWQTAEMDERARRENDVGVLGMWLGWEGRQAMQAKRVYRKHE